MADMSDSTRKRVIRLLIAALAVSLVDCSAQPSDQTQNVGVSEGASLIQFDSTDRAKIAASDSLVRAAKGSDLDWLRQFRSLTTQWQLASLGFSEGPFDTEASPALRNAIRTYQQSRGLTIDGNPLSGELERALEKDFDALFDSPPLLPMKQVFASRDGVYAKGAWEFEGMGNQSIAAEIDCDRNTGTCLEAQAILGAIGNMLMTDLQRWRVARWDEVEVVTEPVDFACTRYILRINLVQKAAVKVRSTISNAEHCDGVQTSDIVIRLVDGNDVDAARRRNGGGVFGRLRMTVRAESLFMSRSPE